MSVKMSLRVFSFIIIACLILPFIPNVHGQGNEQLNNDDIATFKAIEDTYIQGGSNSASNYGSTDKMKVKKTSSENRDAFIKFNIGDFDGMVEEAYLKLYVVSLESATLPDGGYTIEARGIQDNQWDEQTLTYENAPSDEGVVLDTVYVSTDDIGQYVTFDVTPHFSSVIHEEVSFRVRGVSISRGGDYATKEHKVQQPPLLEIKKAEKRVPDVPIITSIDGKDAEVVIQWENTAFATSYIIKRSESADGDFEELGEVTSSEYVDGQVVNNQEYFYKIQAVNQYGRSEESQIVSAIPRKPILLEEIKVTRPDGKAVKKLSSENFIQIHAKYQNTTSEELVGDLSIVIEDKNGEYQSLYHVRKKFEPNQTIEVNFGVPIQHKKQDITSIHSFVLDSSDSDRYLSEIEIYK